MNFKTYGTHKQHKKNICSFLHLNENKKRSKSLLIELGL